MKPWIAKRIVQWVSNPMNVSYIAHERGRYRIARFAAFEFRLRVRAVLWLALRIDSDAALDQMACEGWWG